MEKGRLGVEGSKRNGAAAGWRRTVLALALSTATVLSGCQSILEQSYEPSVQPSSNPQIVEEVQKNDPRAALGAREHPRIVASYGGEYKDAKTERLVARIAGALTAVSENPLQSYRSRFSILRPSTPSPCRAAISM